MISRSGFFLLLQPPSRRRKDGGGPVRQRSTVRSVCGIPEFLRQRHRVGKRLFELLVPTALTWAVTMCQPPFSLTRFLEFNLPPTRLVFQLMLKLRLGRLEWLKHLGVTNSCCVSARTSIWFSGQTVSWRHKRVFYSLQPFIYRSKRP